VCSGRDVNVTTVFNIQFKNDKHIFVIRTRKT